MYSESKVSVDEVDLSGQPIHDTQFKVCYGKFRTYYCSQALASPILGDVMESIHYLCEIGRLVQEILEMLNRFFLG
jgi:hypothetical protein